MSIFASLDQLITRKRFIFILARPEKKQNADRQMVIKKVLSIYGLHIFDRDPNSFGTLPGSNHEHNLPSTERFKVLMRAPREHSCLPPAPSVLKFQVRSRTSREHSCVPIPPQPFLLDSITFFTTTLLVLPLSPSPNPYLHETSPNPDVNPKIS